MNIMLVFTQAEMCGISVSNHCGYKGLVYLFHFYPIWGSGG